METLKLKYSEKKDSLEMHEMSSKAAYKRMWAPLHFHASSILNYIEKQ
jgi:hypothetical protein